MRSFSQYLRPIEKDLHINGVSTRDNRARFKSNIGCANLLSINPRCSAMFDGRAEVAFSSTPSFALKNMRFSPWDLYPLLPRGVSQSGELACPHPICTLGTLRWTHGPYQTHRAVACLFLEWFGWKDPVRAARRLSRASMQVGCETSSVVNAHSTRGVALSTGPFSALSIIGYTAVNYGACGPFWPFLWA